MTSRTGPSQAGSQMNHKSNELEPMIQQEDACLILVLELLDTIPHTPRDLTRDPITWWPCDYATIITMRGSRETGPTQCSPANSWPID